MRVVGDQIVLPPKSFWRKGHGFDPMPCAEAAQWIDSYNAWAEVWNKHERSLDLQLSPPWPEAEYVWIAGTRNTMGFIPRTGRQRRMGVIHFTRWSPFAGGWSFCRAPASAEKITWAGWKGSGT